MEYNGCWLDIKMCGNMNIHELNVILFFVNVDFFVASID